MQKKQQIAQDKSRTAQITSSYFCAGLVLSSTGIVSKAAPIIKYMRGWTDKQVQRYCNNRGWSVMYDE